MSDAKILDFNKKRQENIEDKKRNLERVMFNDFLGSYSVIDDFGSHYPIKMVNISKTGCMFQVPWNKKNSSQFENGREMTLRIYFTESSYIPAVVTVRHGHEFVDSRGDIYMRYGCEFDTEVPSYKAIESFVGFIYSFAEHSCLDKGDSKVYFL